MRSSAWQTFNLDLMNFARRHRFLLFEFVHLLIENVSSEKIAFLTSKSIVNFPDLAIPVPTSVYSSSEYEQMERSVSYRVLEYVLRRGGAQELGMGKVGGLNF